MRPAAVALAALALAAPAAAAPPRAGLLVPGRSLGGISLGASTQALVDHWGTSFGICEGCPHPTWYFNYTPFQPQGAGVELRGGRVAAVFTLWSPPGWRARTVAIGAPVAAVTTAFGPLERRDCNGYYALLLPEGRTVSLFYVLAEKVWGFGLSRPGVRPCR